MMSNTSDIQIDDDVDAVVHILIDWFREYGLACAESLQDPHIIYIRNIPPLHKVPACLCSQTSSNTLIIDEAILTVGDTLNILLKYVTRTKGRYSVARHAGPHQASIRISLSDPSLFDILADLFMSV